MSSEEKQRAHIAVELIKAIEALEPIARETMDPESIKAKRYALPLPRPLRMIQTPSGAKILPDPEWVREGFTKD